MKKEIGKPASLLLIALIYVLATAIAAAVYAAAPGAWQVRLLLADVAATAFTFLFSCLLRNASVYDPYWSVQPVVIAAAYLLSGGGGTAGCAVTAVLLLWSVRLTGNWVYTFHGLTRYEDWRYRLLREQTGALYPLINFIGIHMVPTLVVWACTLPAAYLIREQLPLHAPTAALLAMSLVSVWLEFSADRTMHEFRAQGTGGLCREGLWKYARHPNYLGEITFWWWIGLAAVAAGASAQYLAGAAANTALFLAVSIPMADRRQSQKSGYEQYRAETHALLPLPKKATAPV